jgi:hypothetical protein
MVARQLADRVPGEDNREFGEGWQGRIGDGILQLEQWNEVDEINAVGLFIFAATHAVAADGREVMGSRLSAPAQSRVRLHSSLVGLPVYVLSVVVVRPYAQLAQGGR